MTIPTASECNVPIWGFLESQGGKGKIKEIKEFIIEHFNITIVEQDIRNKNDITERIFEKNIHNSLQQLKRKNKVKNVKSDRRWHLIDPVPPAPESNEEDDPLPPDNPDLFLEEDQLQRIIRSIYRYKNIILQGPPGVGKTFVARKIAEKIAGTASESIAMVQFHQSYSYEDFIQGYRPTEEGGFKLRNGAFFEFCKNAEEKLDNKFVFIIDEINRGNLSRIFGELLMLIEADKRGKEYAIALTYMDPDDRFSVPKNVYILGLMNTADRSLAIVDYALRRRFVFETLDPAFERKKYKDYLIDKGVEKVLVERITTNMCSLNKKISVDKDLGDGFQIGHSYFVPEKAETDDWYEEIIKTQIEPLLHEYWFDHPQDVKTTVIDLLK